MLVIQRIESPKGGEFLIEENGNRMAEMVYANAGTGKIIIEHTFVENDLRGTGVGRDLVAEGIRFARDNKLKIVPLCPFAKAIINRTPEFQDVLAK